MELFLWVNQKQYKCACSWNLFVNKVCPWWLFDNLVAEIQHRRFEHHICTGHTLCYKCWLIYTTAEALHATSRRKDKISRDTILLYDQRVSTHGLRRRRSRPWTWLKHCELKLEGYSTISRLDPFSFFALIPAPWQKLKLCQIFLLCSDATSHPQWPLTPLTQLELGCVLPVQYKAIIMW